MFSEHKIHNEVAQQVYACSVSHALCPHLSHLHRKVHGDAFKVSGKETGALRLMTTQSL